MKKTLSKNIRQLYSVHIFAFLAVWLSMFFPGLDILLSIIYLLIVGYISRMPQSSCMQRVTVAACWQGPGIILSVLIHSHIAWLDISNYCYFIMEFWYTPVIPLLSLITLKMPNGYPLYYYLLLFMPLIMSLYFFLCTSAANKNRRHSVS